MVWLVEIRCPTCSIHISIKTRFACGLNLFWSNTIKTVIIYHNVYIYIYIHAIHYHTNMTTYLRCWTYHVIIIYYTFICAMVKTWCIVFGHPSHIGNNQTSWVYQSLLKLIYYSHPQIWVYHGYHSTCWSESWWYIPHTCYIPMNTICV